MLLRIFVSNEEEPNGTGGEEIVSISPVFYEGVLISRPPAPFSSPDERAQGLAVCVTFAPWCCLDCRGLLPAYSLQTICHFCFVPITFGNNKRKQVPESQGCRKSEFALSLL